MNNKNPIVSIITPCYNGATYIPDYIRSLLKQSFSDWEVIFVDDGSVDGSSERVLSLSKNDNRFRVIKTTGRLGAAGARNMGLRSAHGRFIAFLDCDDWWHPNKLEKQIEVMLRTKAGFCCTEYYNCAPDGSILHLTKINPPVTKLRHLLKICRVGCLTVVLDRTQIENIEFSTEPDIPEDYALWDRILMQLELSGKTTAMINEPLAYYRVHSSGKSSNKIYHASAHWRLYKKQMSLPKAIVCFFFYAANGIFNRIRHFFGTY